MHQTCRFVSFLQLLSFVVYTLCWITILDYIVFCKCRASHGQPLAEGLQGFMKGACLVHAGWNLTAMHPKLAKCAYVTLGDCHRLKSNRCTCDDSHCAFPHHLSAAHSNVLPTTFALSSVSRDAA